MTPEHEKQRKQINGEQGAYLTWLSLAFPVYFKRSTVHLGLKIKEGQLMNICPHFKKHTRKAIFMCGNLLPSLYLPF